MNAAIALLMLSNIALVAGDGRTVETRIGDAMERVTFHENGKKAVQVLLKKNKAGKWVPDGVVRTWYPNGKQRGLLKYRLGIKHGKWESFYQNGQRYNSIEYKDGEIVGEARHWYESGTLKSVDTFSKRRGDLHVSHIAFHPNGKVSSMGQYIRKAGTRKSLKNGRWKYFDENGKITKNEIYADGKVSESNKPD